MPIRILIAPDKFKGSLSSRAVCDALTAGMANVDPGVACTPFPLADGGEGTAEILAHHTQGHLVRVSVADPLGRPVTADYGLSGDGRSAYIEMSAASGLRWVGESERDALRSTTFGTGQLMADALSRGVTEIFLGIGGSATTDAATGAATALGFVFLDRHGRPLTVNGSNMIQVYDIDTRRVHPGLAGTTVIALCDVDNPLAGETGAAFVYGPQKGATPEQVRLLDEGLVHLGEVIYRRLGVDIRHLPGAGGGGGFGGGSVAFFGARLNRGIEAIFRIASFEKAMTDADIIITGEGRMDHQTLQGKVVAGVAGLARKHGKRLLAVAGMNDLSLADAAALGIENTWQLIDYANTAESLRNAGMLLKEKIAPEIHQYLTR